MADQASIITVTLHTAIDRVLEVREFEVGAHLPAREMLRYPAGKGVNVSRSLACLGRNSIVTGFVGNNDAPTFAHSLSRCGPGRAMDQLLAVRGPTRENITLLDVDRHTDTHIRTIGYEVSRQDVQRVVSKVGLLTREGSIVVISGSLPPGMTAADFDTMIYVVLGGGGKVVLDVSGKLLAESTSIDLSVQQPVSPRPGGGSKMLWMVKPNRHELAEALNRTDLTDEQAIIEAGRRLSQRVAWVVVTLEAQGALLFGDGRVWKGHCEVPRDQVLSTVGCGDCLLAGVLDAQAGGLGPEAALRRGLAAATANAMRAGVAEYDLNLVRRVEQAATVEALP